MLAAYAVGMAHYNAERLEEGIEALRVFFQLKEELDAEGIEYTPPITGVPLARFSYAHALFNTMRLPLCKEQIAAYLKDVEEAGPQRILNMPSHMLGLSREVTDVERAASRFKVRACAPEAQADAHTMLYMIAERTEGPEAAVPHLVACIVVGADKQQLDARKNLGRLYGLMGEDEKRDEQMALARTLEEKITAEEEEAARKKAEQDAKFEKKNAPEELEDNTAEAEAEAEADGAEEAVVAD